MSGVSRTERQRRPCEGGRCRSKVVSHDCLFVRRNPVEPSRPSGLLCVDASARRAYCLSGKRRPVHMAPPTVGPCVCRPPHPGDRGLGGGAGPPGGGGGVGARTGGPVIEAAREGVADGVRATNCCAFRIGPPFLCSGHENTLQSPIQCVQWASRAFVCRGGGGGR